MRAFAVRVVPVLWLLVLVADVAQSQDVGCLQVAGAEEVLRKGQVLLLGEIHGTNESPEFVQAIVCLALETGLGVTVALELPQSEEPTVVRFVKGGKPRVSREEIARLPFWAKDYQDGRASIAMLDLLEELRKRKVAGENVEVILLDKPQDFARRDQEMADRLLSAVEASPENFFVTLTGNLHNRTAPESGRMGARVVEKLGRARVVSLNVSHTGGSAWICEATAGCGPLELGGRGEGSAPSIQLFEEPDPRGYQGSYFVGAISASPPAKS